MTIITMTDADILALGGTLPRAGFLQVWRGRYIGGRMDFEREAEHSLRDGSFSVDVAGAVAFLLDPRGNRGLRETLCVVIPDTDVITLRDLVGEHSVDRDSLEPVSAPDPAWWVMTQDTIVSAEIDEFGRLVLSQYDGQKLGPFEVQGPKGDKGDVGPAGMQWRGAYSASVDYVLNDAVTYQGTSWFAAVNPPLGETPSTASIYWQQFAVQGSQGNPGPANSLTATATALPNGSAPTAVVTGAAPTQQVQFGIPAGPQGVKGDPGDLQAVGAASVTASNYSIPSLSTRVWTLGGDIAITGLPTISVGQSGTITMVLIQDATGNRKVTWPSVVKWPEGIAPVVSPAPGAVTVVHFLWTGAAGWVGFLGGQNFA